MRLSRHSNSMDTQQRRVRVIPSTLVDERYSSFRTRRTSSNYATLQRRSYRALAIRAIEKNIEDTRPKYGLKNNREK